MNEFLAKMKAALEEEDLPDFIVNDHIRYYHDYICNEMNNGKAEQEILDELGDPRLLARTILDTQMQGEQTQNTRDHVYTDAEDAQDGTYRSRESDSNEFHQGNGPIYLKGGIKGCLIPIIIVSFILVIILRAVISFAYFFAIPLAIILLIIILLKKLRR